MPRKKTSRKRDFSLENMPTLRIRNSKKLKSLNPIDDLKNKRFIAQALIECLQDGDAEAFKEILGAHLDVINKTQFSQQTKIPERTLYRMISKNGNPTLENIARVVHALCA